MYRDKGGQACGLHLTGVGLYFADLCLFSYARQTTGCRLQAVHYCGAVLAGVAAACIFFVWRGAFPQWPSQAAT
jgi:hypothetical protein